MQILKGIALGLTGFLLFMALMFLGFFVTIQYTALNPEFAVQEVQRLDVTQIASEAIAEQVPQEDQEYIPSIEETLIEIKPWVNEQIDYAVNQGYDYILSKTDTLEISISTEGVKPIIAKNLAEAYLQSPPEGYSQLPVAEQEAQISNYQQQVMEAIPSTLEFGLSDIPDDTRQTLEQARQIIGYIQTTFYCLIAACLVLIAIIILILRDKKEITKSLGIIFLVDGFLSLVVFLTLYYTGPQMVNMNDLPSSIQAWMPGFIHNLLSPLGIFSAIILVVGVILMVVSVVVFKNRSMAE